MHLQFIQFENRPAFVGFVFDASAKQQELDQLRNVIKGAGLAYWDYNENSGEFFVDDKWLEMLGLNREDIDSGNRTDWHRFIHPDDREKLLAAVDAAVKSRRSYTLEFRMVHKDGHTVWIQSCGAVVEWDHKKNRALRICGTHLDISERKKNEKEKEQFLFFFDIAPDMMVIVDSTATMKRVNPAATRILGYSEEELLSRPFIEFIYEPDRQPTLEAISQHLQDGYTMNFENRYVCKDGSLCWLSWSSSFDPNEGITYATARDITDQKLVEEQLRGQEEINQALIENSEDGIMLYDRDHRYLYVNPAFERMMGVTRDEVIGLTREDLDFPSELHNFWHDTIERVFQSGTSESLIYELDTPSGRKKLLWNVFPGLRDSEGEIQSVFGVSHDVTEHIRAEEENLKLERLESLGVLAGGIAHDFNNILTVLFGNIAAAKSQLGNPVESGKSLENAEKAFQRASHLTNQLLTFAKGGEPLTENLDLAPLIRETVSFDLSDSKTRLELQFDDDLWHALGDQGQITQVFSNLAINANQAMPNGGRLYISLENTTLAHNKVLGLEAGKYILVCIKDEGIGINSGELSRIFDPYYSTKQTGSGLGLATVYSIIKRHKGHISVTSTPGLGTSFEILLPAIEVAGVDKPAIEHKQKAGAGKSRRILVMDDEVMICDLVTQVLKREGYSVDTAFNGKEAIALVQKAMADSLPYDCIIMDLTIPGGMGGKEAIVKVLELDPEARVIVYSGYAVDPVMAKYSDYGFAGMITKPFSIKELTEEVARQLQ